MKLVNSILVFVAISLMVISSVSAAYGSASAEVGASASVNGSAGTYGANTTTTQGSGATVSVTNPRGIVSIVAGVSVTITRDGETIEITSVDGRTRIESDGTSVETNLPVEAEDSTFRVTLSNGAKAEVKVMPIIASETAIAALKLRVCTEENGCTIELKEVGVDGEARAAYNVKAKKDVKVIGLFRAKMNIEANVDAETRAVISTRIPWWSAISTEVSA